MARQKRHRHAVHRAGHDLIRRLAKRRVNVMRLHVLQRIHLVEAAAANDANTGFLHGVVPFFNRLGVQV